MLTGGAAPERLHIATDWPRMGQGGAELLENWLGVNPHGRLVVVDFLKRVRPLASSTRNRSVYDADYEALEALQSLASEHGVAILEDRTRLEVGRGPRKLGAGGRRRGLPALERAPAAPPSATERRSPDVAKGDSR